MLFINFLDALIASFLVFIGLSIVEAVGASAIIIAAVAFGAVFIYRTFTPWVLSLVIDLFNRENNVA